MHDEARLKQELCPKIHNKRYRSVTLLEQQPLILQRLTSYQIIIIFWEKRTTVKIQERFAIATVYRDRNIPEEPASFWNGNLQWDLLKPHWQMSWDAVFHSVKNIMDTFYKHTQKGHKSFQIQKVQTFRIRGAFDD